MRAYLVVLALLATPLVTAVSQLPGNSSCDNGKGDEMRSDSGTAHAHQGLCAPQPPPPPPPPPPPTCGQVPPATGTAAISGQVFTNVAPTFTPLAGWCVDLTGTDLAGNPITGSILTDGSGNYVFANLPAGTYTVCEEVQAGWHQTSPPSGPVCPDGSFGFGPFAVSDLGGATNLDFGNVTP